MEDCIFCKIINKEIPSSIVYEDDEVIAFNDINPITPVHILVIPKKHVASLIELEKDDEALIGHIFTVINKIAKEKGVDQTGFRIVSNCGEDSGQEVKHLHFHILAGQKMRCKNSINLYTNSSKYGIINIYLRKQKRKEGISYV